MGFAALSPSEDLVRTIGDPIIDSENLVELFHDMEAVWGILGCADKASIWFSTPNPHLGNVAPINFYFLGRGHKVRSFIESAKSVS